MPEDGDALGKFGGQRDVVADEQQRHAVLGHQLPDQGDDLGLHDGVQRAGRLVGDEQFRSGRDRGGNRHALLLAAGELVREGAQGGVRIGQADAFEQGFGLGIGLRPVEAEMGAGDFGDLFADGHYGVEAGGGVLEDEADVAAGEGDWSLSVESLALYVAPPSVLPDISPTRGEIGCHLRLRQSPTLAEARAGDESCQSPPLWGRCPAGQRGVP